MVSESLVATTDGKTCELPFGFEPEARSEPTLDEPRSEPMLDEPRPEPTLDESRSEPTLAESRSEPTFDAVRPESPLDESPLETSEEHFRIRDRFEVASILREKARGRTLVTVAFGDDERDAYLSVIVDVRLDAGWFLIDAPAAWSQRRRLLAARRVQCSFELHRILHRMTAWRPRERDSGSTITLDLPERLLRFQRREYFRIDVPSAAPVRCRIAALPGTTAQPFDLRVLDISLGGIGARLQAPHPRLETGLVIPEVVIELPQIGEVEATLEVRNILDIPLSPTRRETRVGFCFVGLSPTHQVMVQRYINHLQARRLTAGTG